MGAHWKREKVQDHKFDFINVDDFIDNSCWRQFRYMLVFLIIIRGILVYCSDIFTAVNLWTNKNPSSFIEAKNGQLDLGIGGIKLSMVVYKYIFTGCIALGLLLLALDIRRANGIIASRDISYAFTSQIAARYYTVRSYPHYCFFAEIDNSKKFVDNVAFFVFFTFRSEYLSFVGFDFVCYSVCNQLSVNRRFLPSLYQNVDIVKKTGNVCCSPMPLVSSST